MAGIVSKSRRHLRPGRREKGHAASHTVDPHHLVIVPRKWPIAVNRHYVPQGLRSRRIRYPQSFTTDAEARCNARSLNATDIGVCPHTALQLHCLGLEVDGYGVLSKNSAEPKSGQFQPAHHCVGFSALHEPKELESRTGARRAERFSVRNGRTWIRRKLRPHLLTRERLFRPAYGLAPQT